ncbi:cyclase family protein [Pendulispora brunnea]|uniref:Cyclase family protein n=1 Tax=Pendulispora brunnea TaxID=2905690 RepID=A0ABZ2KLC4_9BACT
MKTRTLIGLSSLFAAIAAPLSCSESQAALHEPREDVLQAGPSEWGPDDEIGAANRLDPALVRNAAKLVTTGKSYSLGIEVNSQTPAYGHRTFQVYMTQPENPAGKGIGTKGLTYNDEMIEGWMGVGTQLNGLGHVGIENVYYNGHKEQDILTIHGVKKLGLEKLPPLVTRGVLLDMAAHLGTDMIREGTPFGAADLEAVARQQGVTLQKGDIVLLHTGWLGLMGKDNKRFLEGCPGINREAARFLVSKGIVAIGADTWAVEVVPGEPGAGTFEVNQTLIAKNGIYVLENIRTSELARDKAYEFLFVLGHPKYTGTTQAIINPVALR